MSTSGGHKTAMVTGANKGIGFEVARQLAKLDFYVVLGCRDKSRGQSATERLHRENLHAEAIELDVTDERTVASASNWIRQNVDVLDVLINNAGVNLQRAPASLTDIELLRKTYETNFFGAVALTTAMLPALLKAPAGKIINVSSTLGSLSLQSEPSWEFGGMKWLAYCSSKTALNAATIFFASELAHTSVKVNSVDPGYCATDMNGCRGTRSAAQGAAVVVRAATEVADGPTGGFFDEHGTVPW